MTALPAKQKALCVATRCSTVEQFVATFHRFCDETSFFVATMASRPVGLETAFSIQLEDKTPVLRGLCTVVEAWSTPANRYGRPGVRLAVKRLTNDSMEVFKQLQTARQTAESKVEKVVIPPAPPPARPASEPGVPRSRVVIPPIAAKQTPSSPLPVVVPPKPAAPQPPAVIESERPVRAEGTKPSTPSIVIEDATLTEAEPARAPTAAAPESIVTDELTTPVASETRTPGSSYVLPANPLMNLTDKSLEGFVECALYEETGNFFRAAEDEGSLIDLDDAIVDPPPPIRPIPALSPTAFVPPAQREDDFAPDMTPIPALARLPATPRLQTDPVAIATGAVARPTPPPLPSMPAHPPVLSRPAPVDNTASLLAMSNPGRKRWLVIGGVAAGTSLLLLIIVIAATSGHGGKSADAAPTTKAADEPAKQMPATPPPPTTPETPETPEVAKPAVAGSPEVAKPGTVVQPPEAPETSGDPNAPPVVGNGPCRVTVTSSPAGSIVTLDDQAYGPSPITIDGPCAKRRVDIKHPRYAPGTKWVTLEAGKPSTVDVALARPTHTVMVTSTPSGATVSIAGRPAGTTPTAVKVMGFSGVTLTFEKRGFKTATEKLYSKVENDKVSVKLVKGK